MIRRNRISPILALIALSCAALAQTPPYGPTVYGSTIFVKCKPGKAEPCEAFLQKTLHASMKAHVDRHDIRMGTISRVVIPSAAEAGFSHVYTITTDKPSPAEVSEEYAKVSREARGMSQADYIKQRDELMDFVSSIRWVQLATTGGTPQVGNFAVINFLKTPPGRAADLTELMRTKDLAMAAQFQKDGLRTGWIYRAVLFRGLEDPYNAVEITAFKDAQAATAGLGGPGVAQATFAKVLPGLSYTAYIEQRNALRRVVRTRVVKLLDIVGGMN